MNSNNSGNTFSRGPADTMENRNLTVPRRPYASAPPTFEHTGWQLNLTTYANHLFQHPNPGASQKNTPPNVSQKFNAPEILGSAQRLCKPFENFCKIFATFEYIPFLRQEMSTKQHTNSPECQSITYCNWHDTETFTKHTTNEIPTPIQMNSARKKNSATGLTHTPPPHCRWRRHPETHPQTKCSEITNKSTENYSSDLFTLGSRRMTARTVTIINDRMLA